jgi:ERCC4-related helicase
MYIESLKTSQEEINAIQQEIDKIENDTKETIVESNDYLDKLRFQVIEKTFQLNNYNELCKSFESLKQSTLEETKDYKFKVDLFERIKADPTKKWIIFNDNSASLNEQSDYLQSFKIKCVMLDGGNSKKVEKAIKEFKSGDVQVLLLNSVLEGAGMNLENADYVVFMHRTRPRLVKQVSGRAQRYGRNTPLHIIELFNKNETDILFENEDLSEIQANQYVIDHKF